MEARLINRRKRRWIYRSVALGFTLILLNMNCSPGFQMDYPSSSIDTGGANTLGALNFKCRNPNDRGRANNRFRKVNKLELTNTLRDLLGTTIFDDTAVQTALKGVPNENVAKDLLILPQQHNLFHMEEMFNLSRRVGQMMVEQSAHRTALFPGKTCVSSATISDACATEIIRDFGLRAHRRPLSKEISDSYFTLFKKVSAASNTLEGLKAVTMRFLLNPYLAYHIEEDGSPTGNRIRLTDYEIANRLSYMTTASMPDTQLFQAAARGELQSLTQVQQHAKRLLESTAGKKKVETFFRFYTRLEELKEPNADVGRYIGISPTGIIPIMQAELLDFANNVVWTRNGTVADLMTSNEVFPVNAAFPIDDRMMKILQLSSRPAAGQPAQASKANSGILLRPAVLATESGRTDIIHRAVHLRKKFFCGSSVGAPPQDIGQAKEGIDFNNLSNRDGIHRMTGRPACIGCHATLNPLAYALEGHDQFGRVRTLEPFFASSGQIKTFPINTQVDRAFINPVNDRPAQGAADIIDQMAENDQVKACFALKSFMFFQSRLQNSSIDGCALSDSVAVSMDGSIQSILLSLIANEDIFWRAIVK
jgi:hypothetical protein